MSLPWEAYLPEPAAAFDPYHNGDTDAVALEAFDLILRAVPTPSAKGSGWAEWRHEDSRVVLQARYIEFGRDSLRVAHPRLWVLRPEVPARCVEPTMGDARVRHVSDVVEFMCWAICDALLDIGVDVAEPCMDAPADDLVYWQGEPVEPDPVPAKQVSRGWLPLIVTAVLAVLALSAVVIR